MTTNSKAKKGLTKAELVKEIQAKVRGASPSIRRGSYSAKDLMKLTKAELQRRLRKARVTKSGEVELY